MPIYLQHGNLIDYVPPTDTSTEDVVFMGGLVGVPQAFIQAGELGALSVDGVYIFNKKDGVSVNLGTVVKYCGTTKLAQDSNADLTLGVAVADAEADDFGVKVKINSVLPSSGGGGGGGGEVAVSCGLAFNENGELYVSKGCGLDFGGDGELGVNIAYGCGLDFNEYGQLFATGGGGGGGSEVAIDTSRGLSENSSGIGINIGSGLKFDCSGEVAVEIGSGLEFGACSGVAVKIGNGLSFGSNGELTATGGGGGEVSLCGESGLYFDGSRVAIKYCGNSAITAGINDGVYLKVCTASGLFIDENGYLTYNG